METHRGPQTLQRPRGTDGCKVPVAISALAPKTALAYLRSPSRSLARRLENLRSSLRSLRVPLRPS